jgi:hypothetical protein
MKQAVIAPSMLYLLYPLHGEVDGYPKEQFVEDLVKEVSRQTKHCVSPELISEVRERYSRLFRSGGKTRVHRLYRRYSRTPIAQNSVVQCS